MCSHEVMCSYKGMLRNGLDQIRPRYPSNVVFYMLDSSSGQGRRIFNPVTSVQIRYRVLYVPFV